MDTSLDLAFLGPNGSISDEDAEIAVARVYCAVAEQAAGKNVSAIKAIINTVNGKGNLVAAKLLEAVLPDQDTSSIPLLKIIDVLAGILILCADMSLSAWLSQHIYDPATQAIVDRYCNAKAATRVATVVAKATIRNAATPNKNIVLEQSGACKIVDFGTVRYSDTVVMSDRTTTGTILFTPPEYLTGGRPSPLGDIWMFGLTVIELMSGIPPWPPQGDEEGTNPVHVFNGLADIGDHYPLVLHHYSFEDKFKGDMQDRVGEFRSQLDNIPHLRDFLQRCLAKDPVDRYSASQLLRHPFITSPLSIPFCHVNNTDQPNIDQLELQLAQQPDWDSTTSHN